MSNPKKGGTKATDQQLNPHTTAFRYLSKSKSFLGVALKLRFYQGQFWRWDGFRYLKVSKSQFRAEVTQVLDEVSSDSDKGPLFKVTTTLVANVIQALSGMTLVPENLDLPIWVERNNHTKRNLLSMANGLVDLDALLKGEPVTVSEPNPSWFSQVSLPYPFEPDAQCPKWLDFLNQVLEGDPERISILQEWFGYCLIANTGEQKFLILEGEGRNGKGVICEILTAVLGEENVSNVPLEVFGDRFQLAMTIGKLANIATEVGELPRTAEATLKQFTGGDRMYFDLKGQAGVSVRPSARLVLSANNRPKFEDRSNGVWRRIVLVPFNVEIPPEKMDRDLVKKLRAELPGILNWAVKGEQRLKKQGGFTQSRVVSEAISEYQQETNPARVFLAEQVEIDPSGTVVSLDLYKAYREWCDQRGNKPLPDTAFGKEVKRHFRKEVPKKKGSRGDRQNYYHGIRLLPKVESEEATALELAGFGIKV